MKPRKPDAFIHLRDSAGDGGVRLAVYAHPSAPVATQRASLASRAWRRLRRARGAPAPAPAAEYCRRVAEDVVAASAAFESANVAALVLAGLAEAEAALQASANAAQALHLATRGLR